MKDLGCELYEFAESLWPLNRSLTGEGVRETLLTIKAILPNLKIIEVPTGTKVFDWNVPKEWVISDAYIITPEGEKICHFGTNNLHVVGYSTPYKGKLSLEELQDHLHSLPDQPDAIPYVTSYYAPRWGFCITEEKRRTLKTGEYEVFIDSQLIDGNLNYGELIITGDTKEEIFLSTYICHPSMANNELSGPTVTTFLAKWLTELPNRKYTYRIIFIPETIGSLTYLSKNLEILKDRVKAGFNITCIGDERSYSFVPSRQCNSLSDKVARHVLKWVDPEFKEYSWRDRGSDERQYCSPGIDLPVASIMRTKYGAYPEYHTSLDKLGTVVTGTGLLGGFNVIKSAIEALEKNLTPRATVLGEPNMGKRGLYPTLSQKGIYQDVRLMMDVLTYSDGTQSMLEIAEKCDQPISQIQEICKTLFDFQLISFSD